MTNLQISLIVIGVVVVGGVIGYNKWHEHRAQKNVERAFSDDLDDILMTPDAQSIGSPTASTMAERLEPVLSEQGLDFPEGDEPVMEGIAQEKRAAETEEPLVNWSMSKEPTVDAMIDCIIPLPLEDAVRGEKLLPILQSLRHVGSKPVHFMGLVKDTEESTGDWLPIVHGQIYQSLQVGVQLANRSTALNELEYSELLVRLREIADELGAEPDIPDMPKVMEQAKSMRQFVIDHDARLSINIHSNSEPWKITTLLAVLERQGFDVRPDGRFEMRDASGVPLFNLLTNENVAAEYTSRLTLLLDVPCVAPERDGFGMMSASAKVLSERLNGVIVDDGDQLLNDAMLEQIAGQVQAFYQDMENADIPAGSTRARRLFS